MCIIEVPYSEISSDNLGGPGGTCVIRGCVPKKLLMYGSSYAAEFADSKGFGWQLNENPTLSWEKLVSHKSKEVARLSSLYGNILKNAKCDYIEGRGRLVDKHTVAVTLPDGIIKKVTAKNILIAVGGYPFKPSGVPGAVEHGITSDEALALPSLPSGPIAIIGGGYIAVEFAGIFAGVGKEVQLIVRSDKILRGFDEDCRTLIQTNLTKRGINIVARTDPVSVAKGGQHGFLLTLRSSPGGEEKVLDVGLVMFATGRKPRTHDLGLESVGVQLDTEGAVKVDEFSRTTVEGIWAVGDATNRINLTPVALMEGMAFAKSCFGGELTKPDYSNVASAVFCQPPFASVGYSEEAAIAAFDGDIDVYREEFRPMRNTISGRDEKVLVKLVVHAESDRVLGVHMVGPDSPEIMQGFAVALKAGATKKIFDSTVGIHPSAAEEFVTMRTKSRTVKGQGLAKL